MNDVLITAREMATRWLGNLIATKPLRARDIDHVSAWCHGAYTLANRLGDTEAARMILVVEDELDRLALLRVDGKDVLPELCTLLMKVQEAGQGGEHGSC